MSEILRIRVSLVSAFIVVVICASLGYAVERSDYVNIEGYIAKGAVTGGVLTELEVSVPLDAEVYMGRFDTFPVFLGNQLPYPNPYSIQFALLTVGREADFCVEVIGVGGEKVDGFEFSDVKTGVYRFNLNPPIWPSENVTVVLYYDQIRIGSAELSLAVLNGLK